jgi:PadR family transcriptional regulator, regulatory protein PadR
MKPLRISPQTLLLLESLLRAPLDWRYGYDLSRETGLKSGTLYPILMRMSEKSLLETQWEPAETPGRPPRHMYRLTGEGREFARGAVPDSRRSRALKPAYGERA